MLQPSWLSVHLLVYLSPSESVFLLGCFRLDLSSQSRHYYYLMHSWSTTCICTRSPLITKLSHTNKENFPIWISCLHTWQQSQKQPVLVLSLHWLNIPSACKTSSMTTLWSGALRNTQVLRNTSDICWLRCEHLKIEAKTLKFMNQSLMIAGTRRNSIYSWLTD